MIVKVNRSHLAALVLLVFASDQLGCVSRILFVSFKPEIFRRKFSLSLTLSFTYKQFDFYPTK